MSEENSGILVGQKGNVTVVRIMGKGTHLNSHYLKQFLLQGIGEKPRAIHIDLSQCNYLDSTFLGMLAGLGCKMKERSLPSIRLINGTERIIGMLEGLGIDRLFELVKEQAAADGLKELKTASLSLEERSREMLEAHEKLVEVSPQNEVKFRDVIALLHEKTPPSSKS